MSTQQNTEQGRIIIIDIDGVLNSETARALESNIDSLLAQGKKSIILNGSGLSYITSNGIGSLLNVAKKIQDQGGNIALVELNDEVEALMSVLQISKFLNIFPSKQDAIESFKETFFPARTFEQPKQEDFEETQGTSRFSIEEKEQTDFDSPLIIECSSCGSLIRVYRPGEYICPSCKTQFNVNRDGTAIF